MGKKLYVGNLSYDTTTADLEALFSPLGTCESVAVVTDRDTGRSRGFGFIEMSSQSEAQAPPPPPPERSFASSTVSVRP